MFNPLAAFVRYCSRLATSTANFTRYMHQARIMPGSC